MSLTKVTYSMISKAATNVCDLGADPTGTTDSSPAINVALALRSVVYIPPGTYRLESSLTVYGNTEVFGAGLGVSILKWYGATSGNIFQDSSIVTSTDVNLNIILRDFEIDGNSYAVGSTTGIKMYRVGNALYDNLYVHDVGASLFNYGQSYTDTRNIRVNNCRIENARVGDGFQGAGEDVVFNNCIATNCADTAFATLVDSNLTTNPSSLSPSDVTYNSCHAIGPGGIGFASGPYGMTTDLYATLSNCTTEDVSLNVWFFVCRKLKLIGNHFKAHTNTTTGGVRLDGMEDVTVADNTFEADSNAGTLDYSSLLFTATRQVFGASTFDANTKFATVTGNIFKGNTAPAVRFYVDPAYCIVSDVVVSDNVFAGTTIPVGLAPASGSGTGIFNRMLVSNNTTDSVATCVVNALGSDAQYENVLVENNECVAIPVTGTGGGQIVIGGKTLKTLAAVADGVATTVFTMPASGFHTMQISCYVAAVSVAFSAIAVLINNAGAPKIAWQSNGANCTLTLVGNDVKVTQSGIGAQTVKTVVTYLS